MNKLCIKNIVHCYWSFSLGFRPMGWGGLLKLCEFHLQRWTTGWRGAPHGDRWQGRASWVDAVVLAWEKATSCCSLCSFRCFTKLSMSAAWQRQQFGNLANDGRSSNLQLKLYNSESINAGMWLHQFHHSQYIAFFFKWMSFSSWSCSGPEMSRVTPDVTYSEICDDDGLEIFHAISTYVIIFHPPYLCQFQRSWIPTVVHLPKQDS